MSRWHLLGIQALGVVVCIAWSVIAGWILWKIVGRITELRIGRDEELVGMNYSEHQVADPVRELTLAASAAAEGKAQAADFDAVREGDLIPLARAVRTLVERAASERARARDWGQALTGIRSELLEGNARGSGAAGAAVEELAETRRSLGTALTTLERHRDDHPSVALIEELVRALDRRLALAVADLPRVRSHLERMKEATTRIDRLTTQMARASS